LAPFAGVFQFNQKRLGMVEPIVKSAFGPRVDHEMLSIRTSDRYESLQRRLGRLRAFAEKGLAGSENRLGLLAVGSDIIGNTSALEQHLCPAPQIVPFPFGLHVMNAGGAG
jgi:hypothetical protein